MNAQTWLAAFFTICIYSMVLYKENKLFRIAETVLVSVTAANGIVMSFHNYIKPAIATDIVRDHKYFQLIPIFIGLLMYTRFVRPISWLARIPMSFWIGTGAGYIFTKTPALFFSQIEATFLSFDSVNNIVFIVGVVTVLSYFYFTLNLEKNAVLKGSSRVGRMFILVGFGAAFANTVMSRISVLLGRLQFLLQDWLKLA
ncbi:MAG: hypothetical protein ACOX3V_05860 [Bacillota bacterium]|jgi:hypothetical protein